MVKVNYSPIKELVVHEAVQLDMEDLMRERITPQGTMPLYWCNGIVFSFSSIPMTNQMSKEYLEGKIHWAEAHYSIMKSYTPIVELRDEQYGAPQRIRVIDTSKFSVLHAEFVKWLKEKK
ncbi:MAG: hypothetical protein KGH94_01295 [Candidatus Micrarchaeota archaeon]|nr:hypothetical protein [Candidatus Micrarchaeota archaeon]